MAERLYTWLDVAEALETEARADRLPDWVGACTAYWDGLVIEADCDTDAVASWLGSVFGAALEGGPGAPEVRLEGLTDRRALPVLVEPRGKDNERRPRLRVRSATHSLARPLAAPTEELSVPVVAFHSFKGGVGRTTHALLTAYACARADAPVLLIDGDLEAPGVTWLLDDRLPSPPIAYVDLLALLISADQDEVPKVVDLAASRLQNARLDGVFVLPAFREPRAVRGTVVSPGDLLNRDWNPYLLTDVIADLARRLGAHAALVDLRAGASEMSASLLLDPRVHRVLVTTTSEQSLRGTASMAELLAKDAPAVNSDQPTPALILTQVPLSESSDRPAMKRAERIAETLASMGTADAIDATVRGPVLQTAFRSEWLGLPGSWDEVRGVVESSESAHAVQPLLDWFLLQSTDATQDAVDPPEHGSQSERRRRLADFAESSRFAETAVLQDENGGGLLPTRSLERLAGDHVTEPPIAVVVGAKGSGKTFTFLTLTAAENWKTFGDLVAVPRVQLVSQVVPALASKNLGAAEELLRARRAAVLGREVPSSLELHDAITQGISSNAGPLEWRDVWLDLLARSVGLSEGSPADRMRELATHRSCVMVIDGLEDAFQTFASSEVQQVGLRSLLQDVPAWLRTLPNRPIGLVVFVRADLVRSAIRQNVDHFLAEHQPYRLAWDDTEVLRLAAWCSTRAGVLDFTFEVRDAAQDPLAEGLEPLWGRQMGGARSKEARSAVWVLAALADFRQQIQARDVVTFLGAAARGSLDDTRWDDRLLVPAAMRNALAECSRQKIAQIGEEDATLQDIFARLSRLAQDARQQPFRPQDVGLTDDEVDYLTTTGVVLRDEGGLWMPEIFRLGLGFTNPSRPRVLRLAQRARR